MLDAVPAAGAIEGMASEPGRRPRSVFGQVGELNAVIGEHNLDVVGNGFDELLKERSRRRCIGFVKESGKGDLRRPIDRDKQIELAFFGSNFGNCRYGRSRWDIV